jgi:dihydroflavonol-4-reductase
MKAKVFVTGGDGMLGANLVRELLMNDYGVRAMVLPDSVSPALSGLDVELVEGNILHAEGLWQKLRGCEVVIHTAASTAVHPRRSSMTRMTNTAGTANMLNAAKKAGVRRFIHVGSASSFGHGCMLHPGNELTPYCGNRYGLDYIDSKYLAQNLVLDKAKNGMDALVVNPTYMIGMFDNGFGSNRLIWEALLGRLPVVPSGGKCFVHVKDVAAGITNAITLGKTGECYILGNENMSYSSFLNLVCAQGGIKAPRIKVPGPVAVGYAALMETSCYFVRKKPTLTIALARLASDGQYYSPAKAVNELKLPQTPIAEAVVDAITYFTQSGIYDLI